MPAFGWLALAGLVAAGLWWGGRWFTTASPRDLAHALRAGLAAFSTLAGTGLLLTGRVGLAAAVLGATVMAVRASRARRRGADPIRDQEPGDDPAIETALLSMRLDRATGDVDGTVRSGPLQGRRLKDLGIDELRRLLETARRDDPPSLPVLEAYLDRRYPDWRGAGATAEPPSTASGGMDEATARSILGVGPNADDVEIKAAHRRLMGRMHPDRGGSDFLAAQINRAKDTLLQGQRRR